MFPYKDENPSVLIPVVTIAIVAVNVACWTFVQGLGNEPALSTSVCELGLIPAEFLHRLPDRPRVDDEPVAGRDGLHRTLVARAPGAAVDERIGSPGAHDERTQARLAMAEEIRKTIDPYIAAGHAQIDNIIDPADTRHAIWKGLQVSRDKAVDRPWRKHGVLPV